MGTEEARKVKAKVRQELSGHPDVAGIGLTTGPDGLLVVVNLFRSCDLDLARWPGMVTTKVVGAVEAS